MSTTFVEARHPFEFLLSEAAGQRSRENVTIVSGQVLAAGAVVGKITTSGKFAMYDNQASNGSQAAYGILCYAVDATSGDQPGVIIARDAEVIGDALTWDQIGSPAVDKAAGIVDLAVNHIIVR